MKKLMSLLSRRELLRSITQRYRAAGRKDKQRILDEFVEATGYHRKYAVVLLNQTAENPLTTERKPRHQKRRYSDDVKAALDGVLSTDLESPLTSMNAHAGEMAPPSLPRAEPQAYARHAIAQLLTLLSTPAADTEDPAMDQPRKNAIWATFVMVAPPGSPAGTRRGCRRRRRPSSRRAGRAAPGRRQGWSAR